MNKAVKAFGLILFLTGFILFNSIFFFGTYNLRNESVQFRISDESRREIFLYSAQSLMIEKHSSVFKFINELHHTFEAANQELYSLYGITQDELFDLVARSGSKFTLASVDSLYLGADNTSVFKKKAWHDYGNWLEGREFNTPEELQAQLLSVVAQLLSVVENINRYEIVKQKGFDRYQVKELTFLFAKDASDSSVKNNPLLYLLLTIGLCVLGAMLYILPKLQLQAGIKNNGIFHNAMKSTGWLGIVTGGWLILFYVLLYFYPEYMTNWVTLVDPVSIFLNGHEAGRFFLYGFIYTLCILVMGVRMMIHYRHSAYQKWRTVSVMFFQTAFAFLIPEILIRLNKPYFDFKNIWPLDYSFFFDSRINELIANGTLGVFMLGWGISLIIIGVPVLVYFFGKRWYCSWVCG